MKTSDPGEAADGGRRYRSTLRAQQAELTRALVAKAARENFLDKGWSGTSVRAVASAAGVSEATVYGIFGSKAGLATSLIDGADALAGVEMTIAEIDAARGNPSRQLRAFIGFDRRLFENAGDVLRIIVEGRREHHELQAAYEEGRRRGDTVRAGVFGSWPTQAWRQGITPADALDIYSATCAIETFDILRAERGWSADRIEQWWSSALCEQLLH